MERTDMTNLQITLERCRTLPMFESERPATTEEIRQIEDELQVRLPEQYTSFLQHFGYAGWFGHEILGIRPIDRLTGKPSTVTSDCVSRTKKVRQSWAMQVPGDYVIIGTDGAGGNYLLFTIGALHEGEVHYYNLLDKAEPIKRWKTFQDYLEYQIEEGGL